MTGYNLSRAWFDWSFENPDLVSPGHTAIYFFAIEHCNRLGWKEKFGFPTQMAMDAIGIKKHETFIRYFTDLVNWGFIKLIQKSSNQYSANIICLSSALPKNGKALEKAIQKHRGKQSGSIGSIDKHITIQEPLTMHPLQKWVTENCPRVSRLKKQLTFDESQKLISDLTEPLVKQVLTKMENYTKLNYVSVNLTVREWAKRESIQFSQNGHTTEPTKKLDLSGIKL